MANTSSYILDVDDRRRRLEEALREAQATAESANQAKSEFLSRMSHELRTPLNAVLGFAQLLELDELDRRRSAKSVDQILKGGRHLLDLINEVLDISRIETGDLALSPEPVLVGELIVEEALDLMRPLGRRSAASTWSVDTLGDVRRATCSPTASASSRSCSTCCRTR